jgi:alginate O-acetyltransferase complex protein AlgI
MLFNSIDFAIFIPIVFFLYWFATHNQLRSQNILLVLASYVFYGWWDWRFLSLIIISSLVDFIVGINLSKAEQQVKRKGLLYLSIFVNLGFLGFFKYYNFFAENFSQAFTLIGNPINVSSLNIILPVGISFYTFQTLSYTIDIYNRRLEPTRDIIAFFAFVSFFPQLVAGPIERAANLLPQFYVKRTFDYFKAVDGMRQILWGLFKKMVIADNAANFANLIFNNSDNLSGSTLLLGAIFFSFQIYGDFSGYSDIAIGTARLFGFTLLRNFAFPYFSRDIAEFWRRWHISLSSWFRDYLYIPLGGSMGGVTMKIRNTFIIFIVSGFWHGANWTYIAWGALNAVYFLPLLLFRKNRSHLNNISTEKFLPSMREFINIAITYFLVVIAWVFFRSQSLTQAMRIISEIFSVSIFTIPTFENERKSVIILLLILFFMLIEWLGKSDKYALENLFMTSPRKYRWTFYSLLIFLIGMFMTTDHTPFIYFQF